VASKATTVATVTRCRRTRDQRVAPVIRIRGHRSLGRSATKAETIVPEVQEGGGRAATAGADAWSHSGDFLVLITFTNPSCRIASLFTNVLPTRALTNSTALSLPSPIYAVRASRPIGGVESAAVGAPATLPVCEIQAAGPANGRLAVDEMPAVGTNSYRFLVHDSPSFVTLVYGRPHNHLRSLREGSSRRICRACWRANSIRSSRRIRTGLRKSQLRQSPANQVFRLPLEREPKVGLFSVTSTSSRIFRADGRCGSPIPSRSPLLRPS
jgi:hypothetical protein